MVPVVNQTKTAMTVIRVVHFKHGEDEPDRRYLIDVAAFDKLNDNSQASTTVPTRSR